MTARVLLIGYGNPARGDDGLGPALAQAIEAMDLPGVTVDVDYQLSVDHAAMIAGHDRVVFADAMLGLEAPFRFERLEGAVPEALGSHQVSPEAALALADLLFGKRPEAWVLGLGGQEFGRVAEGLSGRAADNLALALAFLQDWLRQHGIGATPAPAADR